MECSSASPLVLEKSLWECGYTHVAGVDEAGRGCLAGPVVAAAVILPQGLQIEGVRDSKKLSARAREEVCERIRASAISIGVGICTPEEIDQLNILWAAMEAMRRAVSQLLPPPDYLLIDGNTSIPDSQWPAKTVIQGDGRCHTIAAASIIAKTTRDQIMRELHAEYPTYGWERNVGYPTKDHYNALARYGPTPYHRASFRLA